jgi:LacI family transcriptional regulator
MAKNSSARKSPRPTLLDVAERAGVSRATASLVIRNSPLVSATTRASVERVMAELGYVYDRGAARMRATGSLTIGVIIPDLANPFFAVMLAGIEAVLDQAKFSVIFANTNESADKQAVFIQRMREHGVDGLIICPSEGSDECLTHEASAWNLAMVQVLRLAAGSQSDHAGINYRLGMSDATDRLIALGHHRILFVNGNRHHSAQADRLAGYLASMRTHGLSPLPVIELGLTHRAGREAAQTILDLAERPSAIICFNDMLGLGMHRGLADRGVVLGREISLIGFDNVAEADIVCPGLASVATEPFRVGENAARLMLRRIETPDADIEAVIEPTHFVARPSCGPWQQG